jgi:uncharacterized caspase-like protein
MFKFDTSRASAQLFSGINKMKLLYQFSLSFAFMALSAIAHAGDRIALVVGNSSYPTAPLTNPENDAKAMTALLQSAGFEVSQQINTSLDQLESAVKTFGSRIQDPKVKFAVFYFAGHGMQLDWRNYLVPVTARIRTADDVRKQTVDISSLISHMRAAKDRNYLIILDACRDDPFAGSYKAPAAGLSQFDAPIGSVLAYSTSPGKVALDGEGDNGLYTTHLLKEFAVKGVKIEDAFKRTRLNVRLASNGTQIPWETTSLEDDIYLFPDDRKKLTESEQHTLFEKEVAHWLKVKSTLSLPALAEFIQAYPSGSVSELAAARFNRLQGAERERLAQEQAAKTAALVAAERDRQEREAALRAARLKALAAQQEVERQKQEAIKLEKIRTDAVKLLAEQKVQDQAAQLVKAEAARLALVREQELQATRAEQARIAQLKSMQEEQTARAAAEASRLAVIKEQQIQKNLLAQAVVPPPPVAIPLAATPLLLASTPFYSGSTEHQRAYAVGDVFEYQIVDFFTKVTKPLAMKVTQLDVINDLITFNDGEYASDLMGNILTNLRGNSSTPRQFYPAELIIGKRWRTQFVQKRPNGYQFTFRYDLKVVSKERITVPAGTFDTFKIEARGFNIERSARLERNIWIAPNVNADIAHETIVRLSNGQIEQYDRQELVRFAQKAPINHATTSVASR